MAGTLPHAVFVETGLPGPQPAAAFAAELTGCASHAADPAAAVADLPAQVAEFVAWLRRRGEDVPDLVGNWYEVERAPGAGRRASFSLDELPPSPAEGGRWMVWLELAREDLAAALDAAPGAAASLRWVAGQDRSLARELGADDAEDAPGDAVDDLYAARDLLVDAIEVAGPGAPGTRRALRLAIANDRQATAMIAAA